LCDFSKSRTAGFFFGLCPIVFCHYPPTLAFCRAYEGAGGDFITGEGEDRSAMRRAFLVPFGGRYFTASTVDLLSAARTAGRSKRTQRFDKRTTGIRFAFTQASTVRFETLAALATTGFVTSPGVSAAAPVAGAIPLRSVVDAFRMDNLFIPYTR